MPERYFAATEDAGFMGLERIERLREVFFDPEAADALLNRLKTEEDSR